MTQPAISRQMRALERDLGAVLLSRTPQGVTLTPVGRAVLAHARQAVAAVRACRQVARGDGGDEEGERAPRLVIAVGLMASLYVLRPLLATFRAQHPDVEIDLQPAPAQVALSRLLDYAVDIAVIATPVRNSLVRAMPVLHDPLLLVDAPGVTPALARLEDLRDRTVLVLPLGTGLHEQIEEALRERNIPVHPVEYPTAEPIKSAAALGIGVSVLPHSAVQEELRRGTLAGTPITDWAGAERVIQVLVRAEGRLPSHVRTFIALCQARSIAA